MIDDQSEEEQDNVERERTPAKRNQRAPEGTSMDFVVTDL